MTTVVSNASPIIVLSKLGELGRLEELFTSITVVPEVYDEVVNRGKGKPGSQELKDEKFLHLTPVKDPMPLKELQTTRNLGSGEAATLVLAKKIGADLVILDDKQARTIAESNGISVIGTMRILELSYE